MMAGVCGAGWQGWASHDRWISQATPYGTARRFDRQAALALAARERLEGLFPAELRIPTLGRRNSATLRTSRVRAVRPGSSGSAAGPGGGS